MKKAHMFIIDCETTGLLRNSLLLSFGGLVVNSNLEILDTIEVIIQRTEEELIQNCLPNVLELHKKSGLYEQVIKSNCSLLEAKSKFFEIVNKHKQYIEKNGEKKELKHILTNNTVRMDYMWLEETFKEDFLNAFDYRTIDISSLNELVKRWKPELNTQIENLKKGRHTALEDAMETYEELKMYRKVLFNEL